MQTTQLTDRVVEFCRYIREAGYPVGVQESRDALSVATLGLYRKKRHFRYGLRSLLSSSFEDYRKFDTLFDSFWWPEEIRDQTQVKKHIERFETSNPQGSVVFLGKGRVDADDEEEHRQVSGANAVERLRKTDFNALSDLDAAELEEIAARLYRQMSNRLARKMRLSAKNGQLHLRRTIRKNLGHGGEPIHLHFRKRKIEKPRLVILLDVSGSMDKYSFYLLKFILSLQKHFEQIESFIFSTRLLRITEYVKHQGITKSLKLLTLAAEAWSSGTTIGSCLGQFNDRHASRVLSKACSTIILSDGLDTGETIDLERELRKIKLRSRQVIWLNPLKGYTNYAPEAKGMRAALPFIDNLYAAHNLDSLLKLEQILLDV